MKAYEVKPGTGQVLDEIFGGQSRETLRVSDKVRAEVVSCPCRNRDYDGKRSLLFGTYPKESLCKSGAQCGARHEYGALKFLRPEIEAAEEKAGQGTILPVVVSPANGELLWPKAVVMRAPGSDVTRVSVILNNYAFGMSRHLERGTEEWAYKRTDFSAVYEWPQPITIPRSLHDAAVKEFSKVVDLSYIEKPLDGIILVLIRLGGLNSAEHHDQTLGMASTPHPNVGNDRICTGNAVLQRANANTLRAQVYVNLSSSTNYNHGNGNIDSYARMPVVRAALLVGHLGKIHHHYIDAEDLPISAAFAATCTMAAAYKVDCSDNDPVPHLSTAWAQRTISYDAAPVSACETCPNPCVLSLNKGAKDLALVYAAMRTGMVRHHSRSPVLSSQPHVIGASPEMRIAFLAEATLRFVTVSPEAGARKGQNYTPGRASLWIDGISTVLCTAGSIPLGQYRPHGAAGGGDRFMEVVARFGGGYEAQRNNGIGTGAFLTVAGSRDANLVNDCDDGAITGHIWQGLLGLAEAVWFARGYIVPETKTDGSPDAAAYGPSPDTPLRPRPIVESYARALNVLSVAVGLDANEVQALYTEILISAAQRLGLDQEKIRQVIAAGGEYKREALKW